MRHAGVPLETSTPLAQQGGAPAREPVRGALSRERTTGAHVRRTDSHTVRTS